MNTYDWISVLEIDDPLPFPWVEVSFKNGSHKEFFRKDSHHEIETGDWVVTETASGYDVGKVTLSGELVRLQMKKKNIAEDRVIYKIIRPASDRDIEHMHQARNMEKLALVKGRVIARSLGLDMKLGDIEYQADLRKATFFYTADRRIDFRELVKLYAREFRVKIEMRQIGARQETARIGGIGSCGRELCCSTWLSDFKTVVTSAARYQNLAINQAKLSGQCGRLKCCLNYELDVYMESLDRFPMDIESIRTSLGTANLLKTDIFRGIMYYELESTGKNKEAQVFGLRPEQVREIRYKNDRGEIPRDFGETVALTAPGGQADAEDAGFADVTGEIELPEEKRRKGRSRDHRNQGARNQNWQAGPPSDQNRPQRSRSDQPDRRGGQDRQGPRQDKSRQDQPRRERPNNPERPQNSSRPQDQSRKPRPPFNKNKDRFNPPPSNS